MTMAPPRETTAEDVLRALEAAVAAGETDDLDGGVPIGAIVDRVDCGRSTVFKRLQQLRREGRVRKVWGLQPGGRPRRTYLPVG